jgi:hypothetical protein
MRSWFALTRWIVASPRTTCPPLGFASRGVPRKTKDGRSTKSTPALMRFPKIFEFIMINERKLKQF